MGRGIEHTRTLEQAGRVGEPDGVPVGFNLARCGPARARATVEVFKRGRVQEKSFQGHRHLFNSNIMEDFGPISAGLCRGRSWTSTYVDYAGVRWGNSPSGGIFLQSGIDVALVYGCFWPSSLSQSPMWPRARSRLRRALLRSNPASRASSKSWRSSMRASCSALGVNCG